uniref:Uncharacterized protein n=1 Tax=Cannabis sativa TaxID=3483 RepID=A0A803P1Y9_CANSA
MEANLSINKDIRAPVLNPTSYRNLIGKLLNLTITRRNISYVVNRLSQYLSDPRQSHMKVAARILQHLKGTPGQGPFFHSQYSSRFFISKPSRMLTGQLIQTPNDPSLGFVSS